jgi:hypothetical protein
MEDQMMRDIKLYALVLPDDEGNKMVILGDTPMIADNQEALMNALPALMVERPDQKFRLIEFSSPTDLGDACSQ